MYVNETESVRRQLARGRNAVQHNDKVKQTGQGELWEVRETDISVKAARSRYKVFSEQALEALQSLKKEFPYHVIDGLQKKKQLLFFHSNFNLLKFSIWKY